MKPQEGLVNVQVSSQIRPTRSLLRLGSAEPSGPATSLYFWPFAGGAAHFYQGWGLPKLQGVSSYAVELPGRGLRLREAPIPEMSKMVEDVLSSVVPVLEPPFAFFGHSMGALVAFEVTRSLREMGLPLPCHLFVSACRAPHLAARNWPWHNLPEDELVANVEQLAGIPLGALQNRDVRAMMVPVFRSDFRMVEQYQHRPGDPLDIPISTFGGTDDPLIAGEDLTAWSEHTTDFRGGCVYDGGHFYLNDHAADVIALIRQELDQ